MGLLNTEYEGPVPGTVEQRENDPEGPHQRIKVRVEPIHGEIPVRHLPWAVPVEGSPLGSPSPEPSLDHDYGTINVPEVGSTVATYFENGDPIKVKYGRAMPDKNTIPKRFDGQEDEIFQTIQSNLISGDISELETQLPNYPDVRGTLYASGVLFEIDEGDGTERLLWYHPSGWRHEVLPSGDHIIHVEGTQQIMVIDDQEIWVGGNLTEIIKGNEERRVEGTMDETVFGNVTETYQSNHELMVQKNQTITIQQNREKTVIANETNTIQGNQTTTVVGNQSDTIQGTKTETVQGPSTEQVASTKTIQAPLVLIN